MSDLVVGTDVVKNLQERLADMTRKYEIAARNEIREAQTISILVPLAQVLMTRAIETNDSELIRQALDAVVSDTGVSVSLIDDTLASNDILGNAHEYLVREYTVSVTLPVTLTLTVEASSYDDAEDEAINQLDMNGLDSYYVEYNASDGDFYIEEV